MKKILSLFFILFSIQAFSNDFKYITDMRGKTIKIPSSPERVLTIDDGFVEGVMTNLQVINKIKGIGSWAMKRDYKYDFETAKNEKYTLRGWHTMKFLHPWLNELPCVNSPQGNIVDIEAIAAANPDLIIVRLGDCTLNDPEGEKTVKTISAVESLGFPVIVLEAPKLNDISTMHKEISILGKIFNESEKAEKLAVYLFSVQDMIEGRTKNVSRKNKVLYFALNPQARQQGASGSVYGINTPESYIIEHIANAENAFRGNGANVFINIEHLYSIDPDVIILPTFNGYHPPRELYEAPYYVDLQDLKAVKNRRIYAMPWSPMNCARRVEYPIDMLIIAKASYPELFEDIKVHEFVLKFYKDIYGVDDKTAEALRSEQLLDWMKDVDF